MKNLEINLMNETNFILIDGCNFVDYPVGGTLNFSRQLLSVYGKNIALVGLTTDKHELVGKWIKKKINDIEYDFFAIGYYNKQPVKTIIPARLKVYYQLIKYRKQILSYHSKNVFIQGQHILKAVAKWQWESICYRFPGTENPLAISKYSYAKSFAKLFDLWFFPAFKHVDKVLVTADKAEIDNLILRSKGNISKSSVNFLPTHVDIELFKKSDQKVRRAELNLDATKTIIVTSGRLHWAKGWSFLVDVFETYNKHNADSLLIFVGDGSDKASLMQRVSEKNLNKKIFVTGYKEHIELVKYIQAADLFILGSQKEGWSTSLLEAMACGKPIVTTNVSSASTIVTNGKNGYVVNNFDVNEFVNSMIQAVELQGIEEFSEQEIEKYALHNLTNNLGAQWNPAKI